MRVRELGDLLLRSFVGFLGGIKMELNMSVAASSSLSIPFRCFLVRKGAGEKNWDCASSSWRL